MARAGRILGTQRYPVLHCLCSGRWAASGRVGLALWCVGGSQALSLVMSWVCGERSDEDRQEWATDPWPGP